MPSPRIRNRNGYLAIGMTDGGVNASVAESAVLVCDNEPARATFGAFISGINPAVNPTDLLVIQGSASKIVRIKSIVLAGTATTATNVIVNIVRRSSANTGGTTTPIPAVSRDTGNDTSVAVVTLYTANPTTTGNLVGAIDGGRLNLAPAANGAIDRLIFQYTWQNDQAFTLRSAAEFLTINLGGVSSPGGGVLDVSLAWTEE